MVIWQLILSSTLTAQVSEILLSNAPLQIVKGVTPESVLFDMQQELGGLDCLKAKGIHMSRLYFLLNQQLAGNILDKKTITYATRSDG